MNYVSTALTEEATPVMSRCATVYIVDDDPAVRAGLSLLVKACGWTPKPYASAEEFLQNYARDGAGCLILDLQMPGMSGADLADIMKDLDLQLSTIVITAYQDHPMVERAKAAGVLAVVAKPFRDDDLVQKIQQALGSPD